MNTKDLKYYYGKAKKEGWAMAQFNFSSAEQLKGIVEAAVELRSPLLVGTSEGDSAYVGMRQAVALVSAWREETGHPIFLNFDHGKTPESVKKAIELGYDAVHFDGSAYPYEENVEYAKELVELAHSKGVSVVEGEFGKIPGKHSAMYEEEDIVVEKDIYTDPDQAKDFVDRTGVDSLAVIVGTVHGIYKKNPRLEIELLQKIEKKVESALVLHGGSGTPEEDLNSAIKSGVVKVNISTELRSAFATALREFMVENPDEITPYNIFPQAVLAVRKSAEKTIRSLGSYDKAE